ncbi:MAG: hypothetical protein IPH62_05075 [Ignavibacteriae bacterium]|nr:hypothetical protein [Ignavibacteriota bacterium]
MSLHKLKKNKSKIEKFSHIISGIIVLLSAFDKYESQNPNYIFFALAGLIFIQVAIFNDKISKKFPWINNTFIFLEGLVSILIAWDYFKIGKKALPFTYLFAGLIQFIVGYLKMKKISIFKNRMND